MPSIRGIVTTKISVNYGKKYFGFFNDSVIQILRFFQDLGRIRKGHVISIYKFRRDSLKQ